MMVPTPNEDLLSAYPFAELQRVLAPGGRAIVVQSAGGLSEARLREWIGGGENLSFVERGGTGQIAVVVKPPIEGADDWSHWYHAPDNNPLSADTAIRAPYRTQWIGEPRHVPMPAVQTAAGGRIFLATGHIAHKPREEPLLYTLTARSGYNGTILWRRELPEGYMVHRSAFIATADVFYMIDGARCTLLDPATGSEIGEIRAPGAEGELKWMALDKGVLYLLAGAKRDAVHTTLNKSGGRGWGWGALDKGYYKKPLPWGFGETVAAYDIQKKQTLWIHSESSPIDSRTMGVGGGKVFFPPHS